mgnify:CR=1 FL=1
MPEDQPRFVFLVSIQSHGDYDMNPPEEDIVHAATDYGEYDSIMDEYLSNIYMTDRAFGELTEYLTEQYEKDRPQGDCCHGRRPRPQLCGSCGRPYLYR